MAATAKVLEFWLDEVGPTGWYAGDAALDAEIRGRFLAPVAGGAGRRPRRLGDRPARRAGAI